MSKIYLDACIVIYFVEKHPIYAATIETKINSLSETDTLCFSPLIKMECLVMPLRTNDRALQGRFAAFFKSQKMLDLTTGRFDEAARLRADFTSLKTPDALHLAVAMHHKCDEFWTNDSRLSSIAPALVKNIL